MNLINRRRAFGTKTSTARRMLGIAFELFNLAGFFIRIGEQPARRFAVEANRRHNLKMFFDAPWPFFGIVFDPIVPLLDRRTESKMAAVPFEIRHDSIPVLTFHRPRISTTHVGTAALGCPREQSSLQTLNPKHSNYSAHSAQPLQSTIQKSKARPAQKPPRRHRQ